MTRDSRRQAAVIDAALYPQLVTEMSSRCFRGSARFPPLGVRARIDRGGERCAILVATFDLMIDVGFEKARRDE